MTTWLKQSTAADVELGPFVNDTDFKTPETALTVSQADCQLIKNGGAAAQKNDATAASHLAGGHYKVPLNSTDTNTLGRLRLYVNESGALPVWRDFMVVPAVVYDSLVAGSDKLDVNVEEWNATAVPSEHTAGYPIVTVKDGTGTGEIDTASGKVLLQDGSVTAAVVATDAIDADALSADALAEVKTQVVAALATDTYAEPAAVPAATSSLKDKIGWLFMMSRNKRVTTGVLDKVRNDADSADIGVATLSDDGSTFTSGKFS